MSNSNPKFPLKFQFRRGAGFGKAILLLFVLWLLGLALVYLILQKSSLNYLVFSTAFCLMILFFLNKKTLVMAILNENDGVHQLVLDNHVINLHWKNFNWSFVKEQNKTRQAASLLGSLRAQKQLEDDTTLVFEQTVKLQSEDLFTNLKPHQKIDPLHTRHYIALKQDFIRLLISTDPDFFESLMNG